MVACGSVPECATTHSCIGGSHRQVASRRFPYRAVTISAREARGRIVTEGGLEGAGAVPERTETDCSACIGGAVVRERIHTNGSVIAASGIARECSSTDRCIEIPTARSIAGNLKSAR